MNDTKASFLRREPIFATKFVRLLLDQRVANDLGAPAFVLLAVVAHTEDTRRGRPAALFDGELMPMIGASSRRVLAEVRDRAVAAGWLRFQAVSGGKPGLYRVTIPAGLELPSDPTGGR